ncbi:MAG: hypothetical protein ACREPX_13455 [Rhodanobacteraceae bacterium]
MSIVFNTVFALAAMSPAAAEGTNPGALFPHLAKIELKNEGVRLWYPTDKVTRVKSPPAFVKEYEQAGVYASEPIVIDLGNGLPKLGVACDSGPSNDPSCRLLQKFDEPDSAIFESPGTDFVFLASGEIHVFGHTDALYDHRRLFRFDGTRFREVPQPFRYVGIDGKTKAALAITSERGGDAAHPLATLPANSTLTILLNASVGDDENGQNPDYLVRTREGLVGWARMPMQADGTTIVDGLRFAGD